MILRRRLEYILEQAELVRGARVWRAKGAVWLQVRQRSGRFRFQAGAEAQQISHVVRLRANSQLRPGDRFRRGTQILWVHTVHDPDGRGRRLECFCEEGNPTQSNPTQSMPQESQPIGESTNG
ncbi:MAG: phage head closure protein [Alphaproteobacteria bacterium]|nr:phage head closure protein [Alphaproteobacteria bacterium]